MEHLPVYDLRVRALLLMQVVNLFPEHDGEAFHSLFVVASIVLVLQIHR
jgi:hypothetical protein